MSSSHQIPNFRLKKNWISGLSGIVTLLALLYSFWVLISRSSHDIIIFLTFNYCQYYTILHYCTRAACQLSKFNSNLSLSTESDSHQRPSFSFVKIGSLIKEAQELIITSKSEKHSQIEENILSIFFYHYSLNYKIILYEEKKI